MPLTNYYELGVSQPSATGGIRIIRGAALPLSAVQIQMEGQKGSNPVHIIWMTPQGSGLPTIKCKIQVQSEFVLSQGESTSKEP